MHSAPQLPDRYSDPQLVARGGMGEVWRVRDVQLGRDVAFKRLLPGAAEESETTRRARFLREARAIAQLSSHPSVVTIYDVGELDGLPWIAMEWLPGGTLADRLAAGDVAHADALRWLRQVAAALDAAHAAGIVHRDVKPGNVMFDGSGDARIGDFGIARWSVDSATMLTQAGAVIGTASYMSPEQARGESTVPASDQYALSVIAFQLLTGRRPFARDSAVAELAAHVGEQPPAATSFEPRLPRAVDQVFARALAKQPTERYDTCGTAIDALAAALDADSSAAPTRLAATTVLPAARPGRTRRRLPLVLLALVALAAIAWGLAAAQGDDPGDGAGESRTPGAATKSEAPTVPEVGAAAADAIARHERAFELLQQGRFQEAYDLGLAALDDLLGVEPYEAYANYNVGASLIGLGRCAEAMPYLDRSEQLQGQQREIDAARQAVEQCLEEAARPGKGRGKKSRQDD